MLLLSFFREVDGCCGSTAIASEGVADWSESLTDVSEFDGMLACSKVSRVLASAPSIVTLWERLAVQLVSHPLLFLQNNQ